MSANDPRPDDTRPFGPPTVTAADRTEPDYSTAPQAATQRLRQQGTAGHPRQGGRQSVAAPSPRQAHLRVSKVDPLSVMRFSFVMAIVGFIVWFVAVVVLYALLSVLGVFDAISSTVNDLTAADQSGSGAADWFSAGRIIGYAVLIGAVNAVLITLLTTLGAYIYNIAADLVGGVKVTLAESE